MTHARSRTERPAHAPRPHPDREAIRELRRLADRARLPSACPHRACRRAGRCQGALKVPEVFCDQPLPFCLAEAFDGLFEPVARCVRLMRRVRAAGR